MRVALVTHRYSPHIGGIERHVRELAEGLARRNVDVEVLTPEPDRTLPPLSRDGRLTVRRFPELLSLRRYTIAPSLMSRLVTGLAQYDVVHAHNYHELVPLTVALRRPAHFVVTPHYHAPAGGRAARLLRAPHRLVGRPALRRADRVICVSAAEAAALDAEVPGMAGWTVVIPNGVDVARIRAAPPRPVGRPLVLSVGRLVAYKRVDLVVDAVSRLDRPVELVVVGTGPEDRRLRALAARLGVDARFVAHTSDEELHGWLRAASVLVSMSQREAFGLSVLEALAAEARVVASDIPAHRETARYGPEGGASLVPIDAPPDWIAAAIARALAAPPGRWEAGMPTWDDMAAKVARVYSSLVG
jgi:glycosyltransferase involved in cell wall biosynthesis